MSLEDFQLLDNEPFYISIKNRDFLKVYHQQGAQLNRSDQNFEFIFGEKNNYHYVGNAFLKFVKTVRKSDTTSFHYDDPIPLVKIAFGFCFKEARFSTTIGSDIEHRKLFGQVSTIMKVISKRDLAILSQFDNNNENDIPVREKLIVLPPQNRDTSHQKRLISNHTDANKGKRKGYFFSIG